MNDNRNLEIILTKPARDTIFNPVIALREGDANISLIINCGSLEHKYPKLRTDLCHHDRFLVLFRGERQTDRQAERRSRNMSWKNRL